MSNQYPVGETTIRIGAGTAIKIGFFVAFGAFLFSLILSLIALVIGLVLAAAGVGIFHQLYGG